MPSGETLTDQNGTPIGTNTNPMFATFIETESGDKVKTSGTTLTGIDGNVQGTTANPLIVKIQDGTTPVDPNPMKVSGTTLTDTYGEPIGTNANPLILKAVGGAGGKRMKTGNAISTGSTKSVQYYGGTGTSTWYVLEVPLTFKASTIVITQVSQSSPNTTVYRSSLYDNYMNELTTVSYQTGTSSSTGTYTFKTNQLGTSGIYVNATGFSLPVLTANSTYDYIAYE